MDEILEIAKQLNDKILQMPIIIEYQRLESLLGQKIKEDDLKIRRLQKLMSENLHLPIHQEYKVQYQKEKQAFEQNPAYSNYRALKEEVNLLLKELQIIIAANL